MNSKNKIKGFTLIEMAIVLVIIGTLAAIVLRNIGGQSITARDTRRVSDLATVANALSVYMSRFGSYPTSSNYTGLMNELIRVGILARPINDTGVGKSYGYAYCTSSGGGAGSRYILAAYLETPSSAAPNLYASALNNVPGDWQCNMDGTGHNLGGLIWNSTSQCATQERLLCVGN